MPRPVRDALATLVAAALIASGVAPHDRLTWALEVVWVVLGLALYPWFRGRRAPTDLLLVLLVLHSLVLVWGGHSTYERAPLGEWMKGWFGFERNNYDRIGHFVQGFVPAILAREVFIRNAAIRGRGWRFLCVVAVCIAFSAIFELIEWTAAVVLGDGSTAYLATQGDVWDPQKDMLLAAVGCLASLGLLHRMHDRQLKKLGVPVA